jgi:hypothetical protein
MMTDTTTVSRIDAPAADAPTLLTDDEIAAVGGGGVICELIAIFRSALNGVPHMR